MTIPFPQKITMESIFVWLMHRISEEFEEHAVLKGGMSLRLVNCPRTTNDLDYVFVPFSSKKEIVKDLEKIVREIPNAKVSKSMNSKAIRISVKTDEVSLQIEANVSKECKSIAMSTSSLARSVNQLGKVIQIMSFDVALSHKLAVWNERRLIRDLYDVYYIYEVIGEKPDVKTLKGRLLKIESRIPKLRKIKKMDINEFITVLKNEVGELNSKKIREELNPLFKEDELAGLDIRIKASLNRLIVYLEELN